jgi:hypothetical protein
MDLRKMFGPVAWEYTKPHKEELNDHCSSPNSFRVIKSRRIKWSEYVACTGERRGVYGGFCGKT